MPGTSFYKRSNFVTHLPVDCRYSPSHFWLADMGDGRLRVGFTKFATRMLGEIVEVRFEKKPGDALASGDIVGSIEGFKAISDLYCCADGEFAAAPHLAERTTTVEPAESEGGPSESKEPDHDQQIPVASKRRR